ncbi:flagellar hook-basal body complex protein FliE [Parasporobacterium paucivorans]|uniref:Flagellar hook-basal body complex protein FliE n=1 Tax=Parasporobacterium paucivorans DSM 15970 TaxID=1122934 RepID=A0A1M6I7D5_9FIRM|nr:flagellar hook-basal body complex protein FliE [Parasporobacterium paucivorans]SHJ30360.1 flagellar hook-basal body complex protein FliE [Parasporobacterium paucivorans DSM 15970]
MNESFITPIIPVNSTPGWNPASAVEKAEGDSHFKGIFQSAIKGVAESEQELAGQEYLLATGQIEDAHAVPIAAAKAQLSIDLLVQLRNKALESYNEIININI